jgi:GTP-binding protein
MGLDGKTVETFRLTKLMSFSGIDRVPVTEAVAGEIICVAGMEKTSVADTICRSAVTATDSTQPVDPPTMAITITVNDVRYAGTEGKKLTSTMIRDAPVRRSGNQRRD